MKKRDKETYIYPDILIFFQIDRKLPSNRRWYGTIPSTSIDIRVSALKIMSEHWRNVVVGLDQRLQGVSKFEAWLGLIRGGLEGGGIVALSGRELVQVSELGLVLRKSHAPFCGVEGRSWRVEAAHDRRGRAVLGKALELWETGLALVHGDMVVLVVLLDIKSHGLRLVVGPEKMGRSGCEFGVAICD